MTNNHENVERWISRPSVRGNKFSLFLVLFYLFLEYGRPWNLIPGLELLRLPMVTVIFLMLALVFSGNLNFTDKHTKLFVLLLMLMSIHVPLATNNYWAFHILKGMIISFIVYLGIIAYINTFNKFITLINVWLGIHFYLAINGILSGGRGIGGFLGDENDFSMTLNMVIPIAYLMILNEKKLKIKFVYIILTGFFLLANIFSLSRGGFLGLVAVALFCWLKSKKKVKSVFIILILIIALTPFIPDKYMSEIESIKIEGASEGTTGEERVFEWKIGWAMFLDNPIIGVGQGNFPYRFREYEIASGYPDGLHGRSRAGRSAHSLYFTLIPELGIIGVIIFLAMINLIHKDVKEIRREISSDESPLHLQKEKIFNLLIAMEASLIGYLVSGIFISILYYPNFWILMGFVLAMKKSILGDHEEYSTSH